MRSKRLLATAALAATAMVCAVGTTSLPAVASTTAANAAAENTPQPGGPLVHPATNGPVANVATTNTVSLNWSGYAISGKKTYSDVTSSWVVPTVTCTGQPDQWSSEWVGLDGYNDQTVEQDGTEAWCGGASDTTPKYEAWYEMFPAGSVNLFAVHPGDIIDATVVYSDSTGNFTLTVTDLSTGKTGTDTAACSTCARASAEWIIERPALCNDAFTKCFITQLVDFSPSTMSGDEAQVDGGAALKGVGTFNNDAIDIINPDANGDGGFYSLDTVSPLSGKSFTATWTEPGTTVPITL
jgi:Peptidase A4 family